MNKGYSVILLLTMLLTACSKEGPGGVTERTLLPPGNDGEGSAIIVYPDVLVSDALTSIRLEFTVGESGIPAGGAIALGLHHAAEWPYLQTRFPDQENYVRADGPDHAGLALSYIEYASPTMFRNKLQGQKQDAIFRQVLLVSVTRGNLYPGDKVAFTLGGDRKIRVPKSTVAGHEFRFTTDADGDGIFLGIADSPRLDIMAGPLARFSAAIPAQVQIGEPFDVLIRAEDRNLNIVEDYSGSVTLRDEQGNIVLASVPLDHGLAHVSVVVHDTGAQRLRIEDTGGTVSGRSNPARSFVTLPDLRLYWGDIHGHTSVSDGLGPDADDFFRYGRDVGGLDVIALTDHGHNDWPANIAAVQKYYEPGKYVTLLAQEAGAVMDHMNIYFRRDDTAHIERWQKELQAFYTQIDTQYNAGKEPEAMIGPHHFSFDRGDDRYPFGLWDERSARFVEVYSSHGASEFPGNERPLYDYYRGEEKYMQYGLARGLRFGVIGASDNHDSKPGRSNWGHYPGGVAGFWATELTREAVWEAMWNFHVYATSLDRIYLEFSVDGRMMGSVYDTDSAVSINAVIIGKTDNLMVDVLRDNETIHHESTLNGMIKLDFGDEPANGSHFYYLRVTQDNGERAWSTPVWVNRI